MKPLRSGVAGLGVAGPRVILGQAHLLLPMLA